MRNLPSLLFDAYYVIFQINAEPAILESTWKEILK